ncbi:MAG TPA: exodeoxyribonuclease III [Gammaproteobacteria bacterium]|nr:exodeoxyribonuclease III [Gammaproteobacteria bacterium]
MKIITLNVNGIRASARKGLFGWLAMQNADVVCLQETRAHEEQLDELFYPQGYHCYFHCAEKKGYSGVAIYSRLEPQRVVYGLEESPEFHGEGRYIEAQFKGLSVVSVYLPSGSSGEHRQASKFRFLDFFLPLLERLRKSGREYIICGDWNIAHKEIDLKNWRGNQKNSGFLPEERAWLTRIFDEIGYIDAFRVVNTDADQYTWWSNRGQAWAKNVGWRIDYHIVTPGLAQRIRSASIYKEERFSDHAPLIMEYDLAGIAL